MKYEFQFLLDLNQIASSTITQVNWTLNTDWFSQSIKDYIIIINIELFTLTSIDNFFYILNQQNKPYCTEQNTTTHPLKDNASLSLENLN